MSVSYEKKYSSGECLLGDILAAMLISVIVQDPSHPANIGAYFFLGKAALIDGPKYGWGILRRSVSNAVYQTFHRSASEENR